MSERGRRGETESDPIVSVESPPSKVIQIQAASQPGDHNSGPHVQLFALCEDGSYPASGGEQMTEQHNCTICRGNRPHNGEMCLGCGTQLSKLAGMKPKRVVHHECPACSAGGPHKQLEAGRFCCKKCTAVFESADGWAVDDRPEINAQRMEDMRNRKRGGYRPK